MTRNLLSILVLSLVLSITALPAFADSDDKRKELTLTPEKITCVKTALEKRENALVAAWEARFNASKKAIQDRLTALKAAWDLTDKNARKQAVKTAVKTAKDALKSSRNQFRDSRKATWEQFSKDKKACGVKNSFDTEARGNDSDD